MTRLWHQLLRSNLPPDLFEDLAYASFGLGDTSYEKFCWPSKLLARRLESLGGLEICRRGEGDEQDPLGYVYLCSIICWENVVLKRSYFVFRIDGALDPWIDNLLKSLLQLYPLSPGAEIISTDDTPPPRISLSEISVNYFQNVEDPLQTDRSYYTATVKCNQRITANDWDQDVRHFEFDFVDDIQ